MYIYIYIFVCDDFGPNLNHIVLNTFKKVGRNRGCTCPRAWHDQAPSVHLAPPGPPCPPP